MCGLHCIVDFTCQVSAESIQKMLQSTTHRGKDNTQYQTLQENKFQIFLGHNLLQINTNSPLAFQPFSDEKQSCWLIFNGEIYNFREIDKKFCFENKSKSDTETLWHYLQKVSENPSLWGELEGIFAFIFYDSQREILLTARDEWGVKPLYMYQDSQKWLFASEVQSFWASGLLTAQIRQEAITEYLLYKFALPPHTFFKQIHAHPTALCIHSLQSNQKTEIAYLLKKEGFQTNWNKNFILKRSEELLEQAIHNQVQGTYPPALLLSGGADSTLLLALAQKLGYQLPAFSFCTNEKNFTQDAFYIQKAQEIYEVKTEKICISDKDAELLSELVCQMDYPVADSAFLATFLLSRKAHEQGFRVLWSGAGADELFVGYHRHWAFYWYLMMPKKWLNAQKIFDFLPKNRLQRKFFQNLDISTTQTFLNFASLDIFQPKKHHYFTEITNLQEALDWEMKYYLPADLLKINDFWGMRNTLEIRVPYLDKNLSDFARQIPAEIRLKYGKKWILKEILRKNKGKIFTTRSKEGLGIPFGNWLRKNEKKFLWAFAEQSPNPLFEFVSQERVKFLLYNHQNGKADYTSELFALYVLAEWLKGK
jgi:asparagine synthase (glutamine-hydrolysing)